MLKNIFAKQWLRKVCCRLRSSAAWSFFIKGTTQQIVVLYQNDIKVSVVQLGN